jgi:hypothetical protein
MPCVAAALVSLVAFCLMSVTEGSQERYKRGKRQRQKESRVQRWRANKREQGGRARNVYNSRGACLQE